ncbi:GntR family transcriptional regulator [Paludifilum halophilum]|uniref:GntR family transcriptional regulator n=1 Tax=Paludifilum halophilum TaxID=1642702 RepID=A0A235BA78_9BACL|nr:GntR family transcriptional regulator [Paludifilum halophilum]OYD09181.1 GntR family transcriptional regulator [Paludifilum halophilum]
MSKYEVISEEMRKRIKNGFYSMEQPIPDELSLAEEFKCSRMTMKKALDLLVSEGMLYRKRGHGTFIIKSAIQDSRVNVVSKETVGLTNLLKDKKVSSTVIRFEVQFPSEEVMTHLAIDADTPVYHIIRLRKVEDEPYVIERTYMSTQLVPGINEKVLHASIYNHITQTLGLTIGGSHRKIRACKPNELDQEYLDCQPDDPILEVELVGFLNTGNPFEYSFARHRYDKFVVTTVDVRQ